MGGQKNSWEKSETCLCRLPPLTSGQAAAAVSPLTGPPDGAFCCEQPSSPAHQRQPGLADPCSAGQLHCAAACCCLQSCGLLTRALRRTGNLLVSGQYQHHTPLSPSSLRQKQALESSPPLQRLALSTASALPCHGICSPVIPLDSSLLPAAQIPPWAKNYLFLCQWSDDFCPILLGTAPAFDLPG